jgi:hypothetical protein
MGRKSGLYLNSTGKMFLAAVGAWAGSKIYQNFNSSPAPQRDADDTPNRLYSKPAEQQRTYVLTKLPEVTPEELEAQRAARVTAAYNHVMTVASSESFIAWETAAAAKVAAKEARISALHASGQWRWWMSQTLQGWAILLTLLWAVSAPVAWGLSMILTHGDWGASALHGVASFGYIIVTAAAFF